MGCFVAGTQIIMEDDTVKNIENIEIGDVVTSFDVGTSSVVDSKVTKTYVHTDRYYMILNGNIKTTSVHPFYTDGKWIEAGDLSIGDKILHVDGLEHTIETIELSDEQVTVYNFEVDGTHNYFAEGYLVHNKDSLLWSTMLVSGSSLEGSSSFRTHADMNVGDTVLAASIEGLPDTDIAAEFLLWEYTGSDIASQITLVTASIESIWTSSHADFKLIETPGKSEPLKITDDHILLAKSGSVWAFEYVGDIDVTYTLVSSSLEEAVISTITQITGSQTTGSFRRLDIEPQDTYFADGILVHN